MTSNDSRGLESPDRRDASTPSTRARTNHQAHTNDESVRARLEAIGRLTRSLLEDVRTTDESPLADIDEETRRNATRRLREVQAEAERVDLELFGPAITLPDRDDGPDTEPRPIVDESLPTTYRGP